MSSIPQRVWKNGASEDVHRQPHAHRSEQRQPGSQFVDTSVVFSFGRQHTMATLMQAAKRDRMTSEPTTWPNRAAGKRKKPLVSGDLLH